MKTDRNDFHERLVVALEGEDDTRLAEELSDARAADIAESFELIPEIDRSRILYALPPHTSAEVVVLLDEDLRGEIVEDLDTDSLTELVTELPPDDAADVLAELPEAESNEILEHLPDEKSDKIEELLEYDEETAGGIMTPDVVAAPATATVGDAVEYVRNATQEEDLSEIYVVDADRKLVGTVPLRRLVTNPPTTRLADICDANPVVVYTSDDQETVLQVIRKYDAIEAAVVDAEDRLVGRITHDDLQDVAEDEAEEDILRLAGTDAAELETHSVLQAARIRMTWLLPCMFGMLLTATILRISKSSFDVALFATLALFVPMIGATGGNAGIQISTIIIRGFAAGDLGSTKLLRVAFREGRIALTLAPICGIAAWGLVSAFFPVFSRMAPDGPQHSDPARVALAVGTAMTSAILGAAFLGIALPFTFRRLRVDPAIASGPLVTTLNDVVSVGVYMLLAMLIAS